MKKHLTKRRVLLALVVVALAIGGSVAYAYWTSTGSGSGSAAAATTSGITVLQTSTLNPMYPGDSAQTLSGTFNNTNSGPVYIGAVTASISSVTKAVGAPAGTCDASDFTLGGSAPVAAEVPVGSPSTATWSGLTIKFNNKPATNQDGCKGATVGLSYATS